MHDAVRRGIGFAAVFGMMFAARIAQATIVTPGTIKKVSANTWLQNPNGIAPDGKRGIYVADQGNNRILDIDKNGNAVIVAGNGKYSSNASGDGDGGPAIQASIHFPADVSSNGKGGFYIADTNNNRIREVDVNGIITTVAGGGYDLYKEGVQATSVRISNPISVSSDGKGGFYFITDTGRSVWEVDANGIMILVAGNGDNTSSGDGGPALQAGMAPTQVIQDGKGGFYIIDGLSDRIREVNANGIINTIKYGGDIIYTDITVVPHRIGLNRNGGLYITDAQNHRIYEMNARGNVSIIAGNGQWGSNIYYSDGDLDLAINIEIDNPTGVASDGERGFYFAEGTKNEIWDVWGSGVANNHAPNARTTSVNTLINEPVAIRLQGTDIDDDALSYSVEKPPSHGTLSGTAPNLVYAPAADFTGYDSFIFKVSDGQIDSADAQMILHVAPSPQPPRRIITVAGGGDNNPGNGNPAVQAKLNTPSGVDSDGKNGFFFADYANQVIRHVDANGIIATVAGNGTAGFSGDGGSAIQAELNGPTDVAHDDAGGFFIADSDNNRIRHVDASGVIQTVAGNGTKGYSGDGDYATHAELNHPSGVVSVGNRDFLIADSDNHRVRYIAADGIITTVAGNGTAGFTGDDSLAVQAKLNYPEGISLDGIGGFYIADMGNGRIREVNSLGIITTVAGYGSGGSYDEGVPAISAKLSVPNHVASNGDGGFYFTDWGNYRIREVDKNGIIQTVAGYGSHGFSGDGGPAILAKIGAPMDVASNGKGGFYIADEDNARIREVSAPGAYVLKPPVASSQSVTTSISKAVSFQLQTTDSYKDPLTYVIVVPPSHGALYGTPPNLSYAPYPDYSGDDSFSFKAVEDTLESNVATVSIAINSASPPVGVIVTVAGDGTAGFWGDDGPAVLAKLWGPIGVASDGAGGFFFADGDRIRHADANGIIRTVAGDGSAGDSGDGGPAIQAELNHPTNAVPDGEGGFFIADFGNHRIREVDANGIIRTVAGNGTEDFSGDGGLALEAALDYPSSVASDGAGGFYIADWGNSRIRRVSANGIITTVAGGGIPDHSLGDGGPAIQAELSGPFGIAADGKGGFFIADNGSDRVREVDANGIITTVAGNGTAGYSGDNGPASQAKLSQPLGVAPDGKGGFYIADTNGDRIREVNKNGIITTVAGGNGSGFSGDGGLATQAELNGPMGIAPDGAGGFFIADSVNHRIRRIYGTFVITDRAPVARNQKITAPKNKSLIFTPQASDIDGDSLSFMMVTSPSHGKLSGTGSSFDYVPDLGYSGDDSFTFKANDGQLDSNVATVSISIPDHAPVAKALSAIILKNKKTEITLQGTDADDDPLTFSIMNPPAHGTLAGTPPNLTYAPNADYIGDDSFGFKTSDGQIDSDIETTSIRVYLGYIRTIAGTGFIGFSGDNMPALQTELDQPSHAFLDGKGGFYVTDSGSNRIRRIDANGIITTIVGTGMSGFSGDGGPAVQAQIYAPTSIISDGKGGFYFTDTGNSRIREVNTEGIITTVAGGGGYTTNFGDGGPATQANLNEPDGLSLDGKGGLYIADSGHNMIREVDANGIITTVAGSKPYYVDYTGDGGLAIKATLAKPAAVLSDEVGGFYIADTGNSRIRKVDASGIIRTVFVSGNFNSPVSIISDGTEGFVIADAKRIWKADAEGFITTVAGIGTTGFSGDGGSAAQAELNNPSDAIPNGKDGFYITDSSNHRIRKVDANGIINTVAGNGEFAFSGDRGSAIQAQLYAPTDVKPDGKGGIYIVDNKNNRIREVDAQGIITTVAGNGLSGFSGDGGPAKQAEFNNPYRVSPDGAGGFYIVDNGNQRIRRVDASGIVTTVAGNGSEGFYGDGGPAIQAELNNPLGVTHDGKGGIYIADSWNHRIREVDKNGIITTVAGNGMDGISLGGGIATMSPLNPSNVSLDDKGGFYITDRWYNQIREVDGNGSITLVAGIGNSLLNSYGDNIGDDGPASHAVLNSSEDALSDDNGGLYIPTNYDNRIREVNANGIIFTVVGDGKAGFSGDGGPDVLAELYAPNAIASNGKGGFYIADTGNNRIREVYVSDDAPFLFGDLNGDGKVTIQDATLLLRIAIGLDAPTEVQKETGDMNGDGKMNIQDVTLALRTAVGLR